MSWLGRTLLLGILGPLVALNLPAQRRSGVTSGAPLPSATALGAGALHFGPSATARSTIPARAPAYRSPGYRSAGRVYRSHGVYGRNYRNFPFAYWLAPYYYAPFDYSDNSYAQAPEEPGYDPAEDAAMMAQTQLIQEVRNLSAQVAGLQYNQQMQAQAAGEQQDSAPPEPPVTLVLRDGQRLEVHSYAVMDRTFWDFSAQPVRRIPVSNIDIAASTKATEAQGGEFPRLPAAQ